MKTQTTTTPKAAIYCRVSTQDQADHGVSLAAQQEKCTAMATVHDAEIIETIIDGGQSAKSLDRPGMAQLLDMVNRKQIDTVIILKLDRLTRSVRDLSKLLELFDRRGVSLISVSESLDTSTAAGRLVINIMGAVSQWEREAIGERTSMALQHKRAQGQRVGTLPFGYTLGVDGVHLIENRAEKEILDIMRELRAAGFTLEQIANELTAQGFRTRGGGAWRKQNIYNILRKAA
jgi:site-specific DNA recombinase